VRGLFFVVGLALSVAGGRLAQADAIAARGWRVGPAGAFAVSDAAGAVRVTTSAITLEQAAVFTADMVEA
jgi:hypothetical protein